MRKYAIDLTTDDRLIVNDSEVILDYIESVEDADRITLRGYFEADGTDFSVTVSSDFAFRVAL